MKNQLKRRAVILLVSFMLVAGISVILNKASFDPDFSVVDVVTGATKHSQSDSSKTDTAASRSYSAEDLALSDETAYVEETVEGKGNRYVVLKKSELPNDTLVLLSDKDNTDYGEAVLQVAEYYENIGYRVEIREYSETMMLSLAHAGHFDLFLLREEEAE